MNDGHDSPSRLPLEHVVVADLTQAWAGSYATQLIADLGAMMIKVESRARPDPWRGGFRGERGLPVYPGGDPGERPYNRAFLANSVNRNKYGITLDLSSTEGHALFLELVRQSDVVAENFTPRVLGNLGLGFDELKRIRPDIILLSMPAYGLSGPYRDFPGIGGTVEPMSGNSSLLGAMDGPPQVSGMMYPDPVAGLHGALAVVAALAHRDRTGDGTHVEVSQHEAMVSMLGEFFGVPDLQELGPMGNRDLSMSPHGIYPCSGDNEWIALAIRDDVEWERFTRVAVDIPGLSSSRLKSLEGRWKEREHIDELIADWTQKHDALELEASLQHEGFAAARVRSMREAVDCPQMSARDYFEEIEQPEVGLQRMAGVVPRLHRTPGSVRMPAPGHGEHSRKILAELLGIGDATFGELVAAGITGEGPPSDWE